MDPVIKKNSLKYRFLNIFNYYYLEWNLKLSINTEESVWKLLRISENTFRFLTICRSIRKLIKKLKSYKRNKREAVIKGKRKRLVRNFISVKTLINVNNWHYFDENLHRKIETFYRESSITERSKICSTYESVYYFATFQSCEIKRLVTNKQAI